MFLNNVLRIFFPTLLLSGCLASGPHIASHENYRGPVIAAITPAEGQAGQMTGWLIKRELDAQLPERIGASGVFSAVQTIHSPAAPNEADILLKPHLLEPASTAHGELGVRIRALAKASGETVFEKDYRIACQPCALGTLEPQAMDRLAAQMNRDLKRKFAKPVVD